MAQNNPESSLEFSKSLEKHTTAIPGLVWFDLPVHGDNRGWFKENWQREKMVAVGLPDFGPVQNNMSFNDKIGTTRGIHAEPWDKYVSVGTGRVFGAWVDLREGESFGKAFTLEIDPTKSIFVPKGVGNAFQVLEEETLYSYLVNDHWSADGNYAFLNLADPTIALHWPIDLASAELSDKDKNHPKLENVTPFKKKRTLVTGSNGQLGTALKDIFPDAEFVDRSSFDISSAEASDSKDWQQYETIINAAAYTKVDQAETAEGALEAFTANALALEHLARIALKHKIKVVHISSDYVFDGSKEIHDEDEAFSPINVYGASKAAGDAIITKIPQHYLLRATWVVGSGPNFVGTMKSLAEKGIKPNVVNDQFGRLTFTEDLARAIRHLLDTSAPYGTYNLTNSGESVSWADIAKKTFELTGHNPADVTGVSTEEYYAGKSGIAPRPLQSTLKLDKIEATGFVPRRWDEALQEYIKKL